MKNGKYSKRKGVATKTLVMALAVMLIVGCTIGGTIAWLTDTTDEVTNTFTVGDINITLTETDSNQDSDSDPNTNSYKMVPGNVIAKDPKVTVEANSEACWLFVKIEKSDNFDDFLTYSIADDWMQLTKDKNGNDIIDLVFYREVSATDAAAGISYYVLAGNTNNPNGIVTVKNTVTKEMLTADDFAQPTLKFTAYAVQKDNIADAATAWSELPTT